MMAGQCLFRIFSRSITIKDEQHVPIGLVHILRALLKKLGEQLMDACRYLLVFPSEVSGSPIVTAAGQNLLRGFIVRYYMCLMFLRHLKAMLNKSEKIVRPMVKLLIVCRKQMDFTEPLEGQV